MYDRRGPKIKLKRGPLLREKGLKTAPLINWVRFQKNPNVKKYQALLKA